MISTWDAETTCDGFLGGRLRVFQPRNGYRAGIDPVLLAAAIPARPGQSVLELGCGTGVALLCLAARVGGLAATGLEIQPRYADLARRSAALNDVAAEIVDGCVSAPPVSVRSRRFHHVLCNPPYHEPGSGTRASAEDRDAARRESVPLGDWIAAGSRRLLPRGTMTIIQRADRLPDLLGAVAPHLGGIDIRPVQPRAGRSASLVIVRATKGGRSPAILRDALVLHGGETHLEDGEDFSAAARAVLRYAASLP